ncbi:ATP-dependent RNA helicase HrpA [Austwickia chelonae]|uniref:ATP-dependent RNA helicase HrpA n=1 Tax=Austwickia chelonae TaxID=100225 RepID=UPI000E272CBE|nr:ATP-dependent RNA helicase HrpA [Austwickia chelonae]
MPYQPPQPPRDEPVDPTSRKTGGGKGRRPPRHPGRRQQPDPTAANNRLEGRNEREAHRVEGRSTRRSDQRRSERSPRDGERREQRRRGPETPEQKAERIARREAAHQRRRASVPEITYPDLPVSARKDDIAQAIRDHQVVIVAGETGSGKTTQLPKICLELGRGIKGTIGHTQPRRIAARSVAERIAEELDVEIGAAIGYQVRFTDHTTRDTLVKVMTDGVLLAELQRDRDLRRYDTIVIDEAHERSLNIDFILGYLKQLLPRRPDLKVIVTSATIDPEKFAAHFTDAHGRPAPIIEVSGRTFPVEVRYRPLVRTEPNPKPGGDPLEIEIDQVTGICEAVEELWTEGGGAAGSGGTGGEGGHDILVFLSGEREIRDAADALNGMGLPDTEVLPLFARLSAAEQHRVFARHSGRRIVLATNVAETSLTVPGIRYVVDAGTARISRYSQRTKVQRLPIEPISQASANQRSGRCGRVADGIAIRLYTEEDFAGRSEFTDPEILRTNLASVILQMTSLGLGDISRFPFVDRPDNRMVTDGLRLLHELHAVDPDEPDPRRRLTSVGRQLAAVPVDPRMARMILAAAQEGSLREVLVIVAALSIQDVRERPADKQTQADQAHARFKEEHSDFVTLLNLWRYVKTAQKEKSGSAFRRMCQAEYLHYLRIREWQDLHRELRSVARDLGLVENSASASADQIHRALLTGLLSHVGLRDAEKRDYLGARGARFAIQPGSTLFRRQPDWVMSAELVETTRLWARTNAITDPEWIEHAAQHLVKRSYSEPRWSTSTASAVATERVTLYGIPLVADRTVQYGRIDPETSRDLFIRHALVEGDWTTPHRFFHDNRKLVDKLTEWESRARRRDILVEDEDLVEFYDHRIPKDVVSGAHFDSWWKKEHRRHPDLLTFTEEVLVAEASGGIDEALARDYPQVWHQGDLSLRLTYQFEPGTDADGVTCHIPLDVLNQVDDLGFDWLVPGMRAELATALLKSLPKSTRKHFVPTPDHAQRALSQADPVEGSLTDELARALWINTGVRVDPDEFDLERLPDHLRMTFRVEDRRRRRLAEGKSLTALQEQLAPKVRNTMSRAAGGLEKHGLTSWSFGQLPNTFEAERGRSTIQGFPALVDEGDTVAVQVLASLAEQESATRLGIRRLLLLNTTAPWQRILGLLSNTQKLALGHNPHGSVPALLDDVLACAVDAIVARLVAAKPGRKIRTEQDFQDALAAVRREIVPQVIEIVELVHPVLDRALAVRLSLDRMRSPAAADLKADLTGQLDALVYGGFVAATGFDQLRHLPRYLAGMIERIEKGSVDLRKDAERAAQVARVDAERIKVVESLPAGEREAADVRALRWMLEELRVSLFAQRLGTAGPVSEKRIYKAMDAVEDAHAR